MNKKSDYYLFGIILLMIGIHSLLSEFIGKTFGFFTYLIVGASLLLLYHTKRKTWALVFGVPITTIGLTKFLPYNLIQTNVTGALTLLAMSVIFITLFYTKSINGFLLPGCVLFWLGLYMLISKFVDFSDMRGFLLMFIGFSFLSAYKLGKSSLGKWSLFLGLFIIALSVFFILNLNLLNLFIFRGHFAFSILLLVGSIFFIRKGINS